jgi:DNA-directed RNA polymerase delta subunit
MIKLDEVKKIIKSNGEMPFNDIYSIVKENIFVTDDITDGEKMAELYNSLLVDSTFIMVGDNT